LVHKKSYALNFRKIKDDEIEIFYHSNQRKKYYRTFPRKICVNNKAAYILGLIKGEGANALGISNYRRFTFTNSDYNLVKLVVDFLDNTLLFPRKQIADKTIYIMHHQNKDAAAIAYWSEKLQIPRSKFRCISTEKRTRAYGICHVYLSDLLLRRIIDLLIEHIQNIS
jgi:hypothetical protein